MMKNYVIAIAMSALALGALFAPTVAAQRSTPVSVGAKAPGFVLVDQAGKRVTFAPGAEATPTVLVFYRGSWCPFCVRQLTDLRELLAAGEKVRLYAISIDSPETSAALAKKIGVTYPLLADPGHATIDAYGVRNTTQDGDRFEGIPHPAVFVVDGSGTIRWSHVDEDYKRRPTNAQIRAALDALGQ